MIEGTKFDNKANKRSLYILEEVILVLFKKDVIIGKIII